MLGKLRVEFPGAIYHVMSRGDRREDIFRDDVDRQDFLKTLAEACQKTGFQVHTYCLMGNHFHLVVETGQRRGRTLYCSGGTWREWSGLRHGCGLLHLQRPVERYLGGRQLYPGRWRVCLEHRFLGGQRRLLGRARHRNDCQSAQRRGVPIPGQRSRFGGFRRQRVRGGGRGFL